MPSDQPSGLAATQVSSATPAATGLITGTSANPLDDLVSLFGNMGGTSLQPSVPATGAFVASPTSPQQNAFSGLGISGMTSPPSQPAVSPGAKKDDDDLLGLF